jgi:D-alanyl-lipoteichoic acid acyltransferase DltB (MBOAT superfamily)
MLFDSFAFAVFLPLVFAAYWLLFRGLRAQNAFILLASWAFYAWWDWRFLGLLLLSTFADYAIGLAMHAAADERRRKHLLWLSLAVNLGMLGFFKYFGFFVESFAVLLDSLGVRANLPVLRIALPVGISFYTFQTLSYTLDIHRRVLVPTRDPLAFAAFVSFFPQLVAGPIERARDLLPQFLSMRAFDRDAARDGLRQMLWGLFKKVAVADRFGELADTVFGLDPSAASGITLAMGVLSFALQIYADFSGYSDIAIGCARLFGLRLSRNFAYPYFSRSITEFWRRWHISLSSWFRDYVYIPLGGWRTKAGRMRNILITFGVSGLWHGANWTFVTWGLLHGAYYLPEVLSGHREGTEHATWRDLPRMLLVFAFVCLAWVFFRAESVQGALRFLYHAGANAGLRRWEILEWAMLPVWISAGTMLLAEWRARRQQHALQRLPRAVWLRWVIYLAAVGAILVNMRFYSEHEFLYFRF